MFVAISVAPLVNTVVEISGMGVVVTDTS